MNALLPAVAICIVMSWAVPANAEGVQVGELKSKGAAVLSVEEMKALLSGTRVRWQNDLVLTQMDVNGDGTVAGSTTRTGGAGASGIVNFRGDWRFSEQGRWCAETKFLTNGQGRGGGAKWCRSILRLGDKYYYAGGAATKADAMAYELEVTK
jgi:hypothetical protein